MGHGVSSTQDDKESLCFIWEQFPLIGMIAEFGNFLGTLDRAVRMLRVDHDVIGVVGKKRHSAFDESSHQRRKLWVFLT